MQVPKLSRVRQMIDQERHVAFLYRDDDEYFYVSRACTKDHGWETMVFNSNKLGEVNDWTELYERRGWETIDESIRKFCNKTGRCDSYSLD